MGIQEADDPVVVLLQLWSQTWKPLLPLPVQLPLNTHKVNDGPGPCSRTTSSPTTQACQQK